MCWPVSKLLFIGLGSNIEPRLSFLQEARQLLEARWGAALAASSVYETTAWGYTEQSDFLNQVLLWSSDKEGRLLLRDCLEVEGLLGRVRKIHWGPRCIDIDILALGQERIDSEELRIPHLHIAQRRFVLEPWAELAPDFCEARSSKSIAQLLASCTDSSPLRRIQKLEA